MWVDDPDEGLAWVKDVAGRQWAEAEVIQKGIEIVIRLTDRVEEQSNKIKTLNEAVEATRDIITRQQALIYRLANRLGIRPEDA
jgi:uncharacterized coiled-coil protein SlyX